MAKKKAKAPVEVDVSKWPASKIELRAISVLKDNPNNTRTHTPSQVRMLAAAMKEFGWTMPMLVDEKDTIIAGHGRDQAAELTYKEGGAIRMFDGTPVPKGHVPVICARGWTEIQKRAYIEADNRLNELGGWDQTKRQSQLDYLVAQGFPLAAIGWDKASLNPLAEWGGMPEFSQKDKTAFRSIVVHFRTQEDVDQFAKKVGLKITAQTRYLWFPDIEIERLVDKRYVTGATSSTTKAPRKKAAAEAT